MTRRLLWYAIHFGDQKSADDAIGVVDEIAPSDVGASAKLVSPSSVVFSVGATSVAVRHAAPLLLIEAPNQQEAVGVAWQILVALTVLNPGRVWLSQRAYGADRFAKQAITATPMVVQGETGFSLEPADFERLTA